MNLWAISDLHLSFARPDGRERYAARWRDHVEKLERNWREVVRAEDLVLLPGDLSMARNHRELQPDLEWLARLPGTKVISPGNHDRWWNNLEGIRPILRRSILAVDGDALSTHSVIVAGTLGLPRWSDEPGAIETPAIESELQVLQAALDHADTLRGDSGRPLYVLRHYPPFDAHGRPGPWVERMEQAGVAGCVYGHLHMQSQWGRTVQGNVRGVRYSCVAADAIGFRPIRIGGR